MGKMGKYFGTDGFRGEANETLTVEHAFKVGRFLGWYYSKEHKARVVIGKDTRRSSYMFEYAVTGSSPASLYIHHYPMTFDLEETADLVRAFYGDSVFCHYYRADLDEEDTMAGQPLLSQYVIDSVFRSLDCSDTIVLGGDDGLRAWKEVRVAKRVVVGYFNVPVRKRELFDRAIWSLQPFDSTDYIDDYRKHLMSDGH